MRVIATFGVIGIHLNKIGLSPDDKLSLFLGTAFDQIGHCAVPIFFMISGYFLLRKTEPLREFLNKRLLRIIPPLVFWALAYTFWRDYLRPAEPITLSSLAWQAATINFNFHLWFLFALLGAYLFVPTLREMVRHFTQSQIRVFAGCVFLATGTSTIAWSYTQTITGGMSPPNPAPFHDCFYYLGYMLIPYLSFPLIDRMSMKKSALWLALLTLIASVGVLTLPERIKPLMCNYSSWLVVVESLIAYSLLKKFFARHDRLCRYLATPWITQCCFGVYLIHCIFIDLLFKYVPPIPHSFILHVGLTLTLLVACLFFVRGLSYIPGLHLILGYSPAKKNSATTLPA